MRTQITFHRRYQSRGDRCVLGLRAAGWSALIEALPPRRAWRLDKCRAPPRRRFGEGSVSIACVGKVVELSDAVGLRPNTDLASVGEGFVFDIEQMLAVVVGFEKVSRELDAQRVPLARRNLLFHAVTALAAHDVERTSFAVHSLVKHGVVLVRVRAEDVEVVLVFASPDHAAGLIFLAADWFEFHLD